VRWKARESRKERKALEDLVKERKAMQCRDGHRVQQEREGERERERKREIERER
jgi:hypothetical protein